MRLSVKILGQSQRVKQSMSILTALLGQMHKRYAHFLKIGLAGILRNKMISFDDLRAIRTKSTIAPSLNFTRMKFLLGKASPAAYILK